MALTQLYWHGTSGGGCEGTYPYPMDVVPGAAAGYSVRKLREAYSGPCMRVLNRDGGIDTYLDVGFVCDLVDWATILAFSPNVFLDKWYDQSGNGNDAYAPSFNFPDLVVSNVIPTYEGVKMPKFGDLNLLFLTSTIAGGNYSSAGVANLVNRTTPPQALVSGATAAFGQMVYNGRDRLVRTLTSEVILGNTIADGNHQFYASGGASGTQTIGHDGSYATSVGGQTYNGIASIGSNTDAINTERWNNSGIAEVMLYASVLSGADRDALVANQKSYFGTP